MFCFSLKKKKNNNNKVIPEMSEHGILVVISGKLTRDLQLKCEESAPVLLSSVSGTSKLVRRVDLEPDLRFTAVVAIDNVERVAWIAKQCIDKILLHLFHVTCK